YSLASRERPTVLRSSPVGGRAAVFSHSVARFGSDRPAAPPPARSLRLHPESVRRLTVGSALPTGRPTPEARPECESALRDRVASRARSGWPGLSLRNFGKAAPTTRLEGTPPAWPAPGGAGGPGREALTLVSGHGAAASVAPHGAAVGGRGGPAY